MDKRVLIAAALSVVILVFWSAMFPPPEPTPVPGELAERTDDAAASDEPTFARTDDEAEVSEPPADEAIDAEPVDAEVVEAAAVREIPFDNDIYQLLFTNEGARAVSWKLLDYRTVEGEPLELLPAYVESVALPLSVRVDDPELSRRINAGLYEMERDRVPSSDDRGPGERLTFRWADGRGLAVRKALTFHDGSYRIGVELDVVDRGRRLPASLAIGPGFGAQEKSSSYYYEAWVMNRAGQVGHTQKNKKHGYDDQAAGLSGDVLWAGLEDQYFAALLLPGETPARVHLEPIPELAREPLPGDEEAAKAKTEVMLSVSVSESGADLFVGPKRHKVLMAEGDELDKVLWFFDINLLAWISKQIYLGLLWLHDNTIQNYGLAIVMATFLLRLILFPVNQYSMVSMKKMQLQQQRLQPKIKAIRTKYKKQKDSESRARMNQEMMELYRREGVNPMGGITGCLPLLGQFPILIGFYGMLTVAVELRGAPFFGWITDLSRADPFWITPILMGVTMFAQQMMAMTKVKDPVQQQQQRFMMIMPVVFTVICIGLPSGLVLYWFVNNLLGIGQQYLVNRHTTRLEAEEARARRSNKAAGKAPPAGEGKKSTKLAR